MNKKWLRILILVGVVCIIVLAALLDVADDAGGGLMPAPSATPTAGAMMRLPALADYDGPVVTAGYMPGITKFTSITPTNSTPVGYP